MRLAEMARLRGEAELLYGIIPTLPGRQFVPAMALMWAGVAFLIATGPIFKLGRRISRESSL